MASVAGLAPARTSLKGWLRELLCIHGQKILRHRGREHGVAARGQTLTLWTQFLRGLVDALAAKLARLVGEEWSQRRDDGHESGSNKVADHGLNVFVSGGCFFVEQVAFFADHPATQRRLHQLVHAEAFAHRLASIAARPLATRTVSQGPGVAFTIARWLDEIAQRAA